MSVVYFVEAGDAIKIGTTRRFRRRMNDLSAGLPGGCKLLLAIPGGVAEERQIHHELATSRISNEWFQRSPAVIDKIAQLSPQTIEPVNEAPYGPSLEAAACAHLIKLCACPAVLGEPVPDAILRASNRTGLDIGRTTSIWYGKARNITAAEANTIRVTAIEYGDDIEYLREEVRRLHAELASVGTAIERLDRTGTWLAERIAPEILEETNDDLD